MRLERRREAKEEKGKGKDEGAKERGEGGKAVAGGGEGQCALSAPNKAGAFDASIGGAKNATRTLSLRQDHKERVRKGGGTAGFLARTAGNGGDRQQR